MSRSLHELDSSVMVAAYTMLAAAQAEGLDLLITSTYRTPTQQAKLYRNGRGLPAIRAKAAQLENDWGRGDLADLLMGVGPQFGQRIVTNAGPGQSAHNYRCAFDIVPLRDGKPIWSLKDPEDEALWLKAGKLGKEAGLEWAGDWERFREYPHFQKRGFRWQEDIRSYRWQP